MAGPLYVAGVKESSQSLGTAAFQLQGAEQGFQTFASANFATGDTFYYRAVNVDNPTQVEIGMGTWLADGTIGRAGTSEGLVEFGPGKKTIRLIKLAPIPVSVVAGASGGGQTDGLTDTQLRATPVAVSGPLTDTQLRATPVPISGTVNANVPDGLDVDVRNFPVSFAINNLPATQPISGSVSISNFPATQPVSGPLTDTQLRASAIPVTVGNFPSSFQISNFPASQAVTGPLTDTQLRASAIPVSGTFFQATQPVSIAATVNVAGPLTDTQLRASAVPVSGPLTDAQLAARTVATRDLKDAARTLFAAATVIGGVTCVTTEALLAMVPVRAGVATASANAIQATSGKTLRITAIVVGIRSTAAAAISGRIALRMNPTSALAVTDPILAIASLSQQAGAIAEGGDELVIPLPDGIEISGNQRVGLTQVCSVTTGVVYASIIGFEY